MQTNLQFVFRVSAWTRSKIQSSIGEAPCINILKTACEAQSTECVEYLLDEIMKARKKCLGDSFHGPTSTEQVVPPTLRGRHTLDVKEFLKFTVPRQVVFFELGYDCASSNLAKTNDELEKSLYGLMLANTPKAFLHLLNRYFMSFNR